MEITASGKLAHKGKQYASRSGLRELLGSRSAERNETWQPGEELTRDEAAEGTSEARAGSEEEIGLGMKLGNQ